jgi:hypothetical protein
MSDLIRTKPVIPSPEKLTVGRYQLSAFSRGSHLYSACQLFKNLNVHMKYSTFVQHHQDSPFKFTDLTDSEQILTDFFSILRQTSPAKPVTVDYASTEILDADLESVIGLDSSQFPCIVREAARSGLFGQPSVKYPGVTSWFLYRGTCGSVAAIHDEDRLMYSINYLISGDPKVWMIVEPADHDLCLSDLRTDMSVSGGVGHDCPAFVMHKNVMLDPEWFNKHGIRVSVVVQKPGQAVVVSPMALHQVFNTGMNLAVATNFGTTSWIPFGLTSQTVSCLLPESGRS